MQEVPEALPRGWVATTLGELVEPSRERALPAEFPTLRYVGLEHIESQTMKLLKHGYARDARSSSIRFSKGDVLYGRLRPYLNKVWVATFRGLCSPEFIVFPKSKWISNRFLAFALNAEDFVTFADNRVSGERPRVDFDQLARFPILLPPLLEQERIADKLHAAFSRLERARAATHRARERLLRYRAAVLLAAVNGDITREWRAVQQKTRSFIAQSGKSLLQHLLSARYSLWEKAELERLSAIGEEFKVDEWKSRYREPASPDTSGLSHIPEGWAWASVDQVASGEPGAIQSGPFGSQLLHSEFVDQGILAIGIDNILDGRFSMGSQHRITPEKYEQLKKFTAHPFDVVITVMATVGRVCVLPPDLEPAIITKHCYRISPARGWINPYYLSFALRAAGPTRQHILSNVRGQTRPGINGQVLKTAPVALPPIEEQLEIAREVERRLAAADRLEDTLVRQLKYVKAARRSFLQDALVGQLTPQDPKDEAAYILLERIRVTREAENRKPKAKRMTRKSTNKTVGRRPLLAVLRESGGSMTPEALFRASGYSQESVDEFYAELRELTANPPVIVEERTSTGMRRLKVV